MPKLLQLFCRFLWILPLFLNFLWGFMLGAGRVVMVYQVVGTKVFCVDDNVRTLRPWPFCRHSAGLRLSPLSLWQRLSFVKIRFEFGLPQNFLVYQISNLITPIYVLMQSYQLWFVNSLDFVRLQWKSINANHWSTRNLILDEAFALWSLNSMKSSN